jgi:NAD(P)-dependent dehydrogenase (short-subunit alcohol dehydrogenase family)
MTGRLAGKVAFVFGAGSSGPDLSNGTAAAITFAREGAAVVAVDIDTGAARRTAATIEAEDGAALALTADVTDPAQVAEAVRVGVQRFGPPAVLHNNVGVTQAGGPTELSLEEWHRSFAINLDGVFLTCKHVLPLMLENGGGAIVNVSSVAAIRYTGYPYPSYAAAKAAVNQLTVSLALQHAADGIRVNAVLPGLIDTPLVRQQLAAHHGDRDKLISDRHAASPTGQMGTPWDVARAAAFLASDDAAYINGVTLPVDGGLSARCG